MFNIYFDKDLEVEKHYCPENYDLDDLDEMEDEYLLTEIYEG